MDDKGSVLRLYYRRQAVRGLIILAAAAVAWWAGLFDLLGGDETIAREKVEKEARSLLIYKGEAPSDVSCPRDLEREQGASMTCTYTDVISKVTGSIANPTNPPPPDLGRFEIRIKGFDHTYYGRRSSSSTSEPEYEVRLIERAR